MTNEVARSLKPLWRGGNVASAICVTDSPKITRSTKENISALRIHLVCPKAKHPKDCSAIALKQSASKAAKRRLLHKNLFSISAKCWHSPQKVVFLHRCCVLDSTLSLKGSYVKPSKRSNQDHAGALCHPARR